MQDPDEMMAAAIWYKDQMINEVINHPAHYNQYPGVEVIQITQHMNFCRGNAVKYICRAGFKDPEKEREDLEKARWYLTKEIERLTKLEEKK